MSPLVWEHAAGCIKLSSTGELLRVCFEREEKQSDRRTKARLGKNGQESSRDIQPPRDATAPCLLIFSGDLSALCPSSAGHVNRQQNLCAAGTNHPVAHYLASDLHSILDELLT